jgi:hypothetical protein
MGPLLQATRTVPIVFVQVTDPVGAGYVVAAWSVDRLGRSRSHAESVGSGFRKA